MNIFGTNLTDPFSRKVGIDVSGLFVYGPERITPGTHVRTITSDRVSVSHAHMDHMDLRTLRALTDRDHSCLPTGDDAKMGLQECIGTC